MIRIYTKNPEVYGIFAFNKSDMPSILVNPDIIERVECDFKVLTLEEIEHVLYTSAFDTVECLTRNNENLYVRYYYKVRLKNDDTVYFVSKSVYKDILSRTNYYKGFQYADDVGPEELDNYIKKYVKKKKRSK